MSIDILDLINDSEEIADCDDCGALVVRYKLGRHQRHCGAFQERWQEEYDRQLGASDASELKVDSPPNPKIQAAWVSLGEKLTQGESLGQQFHSESNTEVSKGDSE